LSAPALRYRLTPAAAGDIDAILDESLRQFGIRQVARYAELITQAIDMLCAEPLHVASRLRDDLLPNMRSFHVEHAAGRRGAAAHILYYRVEPDGMIVILRLLHQSMDPTRHLVS
jgi:toxin ParE1/3/4